MKTLVLIVSIPFKREGVFKDNFVNRNTSLSHNRVSIPFKREGVFKVPKKRIEMTIDERFNSLQAGRGVQRTEAQRLAIEGQSFNSLQAGRGVQR